MNTNSSTIVFKLCALFYLIKIQFNCIFNFTLQHFPSLFERILSSVKYDFVMGTSIQLIDQSSCLHARYLPQYLPRKLFSVVYK